MSQEIYKFLLIFENWWTTGLVTSRTTLFTLFLFGHTYWAQPLGGLLYGIPLSTYHFQFDVL
jgi:hypothetical protein